MAHTRITMSADDAERILNRIAPPYSAARKKFVARWGLSNAPFFYWRRDGVPAPASAALAYAWYRSREISTPEEANGDIQAALEGAFSRLAQRVEASDRYTIDDLAAAVADVVHRLDAGEELQISKGGEMPPEVVAASAERLGMSKQDLADHVGTSLRSVDRWITGANPVDKGIAWYLRARLVDALLESDAGDPLQVAVADLVSDAVDLGWEPRAIAVALDTEVAAVTENSSPRMEWGGAPMRGRW